MSGHDSPLALALRERMAQLGMAQRAYADHLGIKQSTFSSVLLGKVALPGIELRRRIAEDLGLSHIEVLVLLGILAPSEAQASPLGPQAHPERDDEREREIDRCTRRMRLMPLDLVLQLSGYADYLLSHSTPSAAPPPTPPPRRAKHSNGPVPTPR